MQGGDPTGTGRGGESIYGSVSMRKFSVFPSHLRGVFKGFRLSGVLFFYELTICIQYSFSFCCLLIVLY